MLPLDATVRKQVEGTCRTLLAAGYQRNEIGIALAQSIGTLILPIQESSDANAASLMDLIRSTTALHRSRDCRALAAAGRNPDVVPPIPEVDEDDTADIFGAFQAVVEAYAEQDTTDEPLNYGTLAEAMVDVLMSLDLAWLTTARVSLLITKSRQTDESLVDADETLFDEAEPSWLN